MGFFGRRPVGPSSPEFGRKLEGELKYEKGKTSEAIKLVNFTRNIVKTIEKSMKEGNYKGMTISLDRTFHAVTKLRDDAVRIHNVAVVLSKQMPEKMTQDELNFATSFSTKTTMALNTVSAVQMMRGDASSELNKLAEELNEMERLVAQLMRIEDKLGIEFHKFQHV